MCKTCIRELWKAPLDPPLPGMAGGCECVISAKTTGNAVLAIRQISHLLSDSAVTGDRRTEEHIQCCIVPRSEVLQQCQKHTLSFPLCRDMVTYRPEQWCSHLADTAVLSDTWISHSGEKKSNSSRSNILCLTSLQECLCSSWALYTAHLLTAHGLFASSPWPA